MKQVTIQYKDDESNYTNMQEVQVTFQIELEFAVLSSIWRVKITSKIEELDTR